MATTSCTCENNGDLCDFCMLRTTIKYTLFLLVLAIGTHLYQYGASGPLADGSSDIQAIRITVMHDVQYMNEMGVRRPGTGVVNGIVNNLETWFTARRGCTHQANIVASSLQLAFPSWRFEVLASPIHHWVEGYDGSGHCLRIDPWTGEVVQKI